MNLIRIPRKLFEKHLQQNAMPIPLLKECISVTQRLLREKNDYDIIIDSKSIHEHFFNVTKKVKGQY